EKPNFIGADDDEFGRLCRSAREFEMIGVDGLVLGFANSSGPDIELTRKILAFAPSLNATFHHAFEETKDKFAAIEKLKTVPQIDRILSHRGKSDLIHRCETLEN